MRVLIANRGEIAARIERTCLRLGYEAVPVVVPGDAFAAESVTSPTVDVPSYLDADAIVAAGLAAACTAVHPGFGFLAENADFARKVIASGLTWVGPHPEAIDHMGSKINARALAEQAGLTLIPGFADSQDDGALADAAAAIGYPVLVKASAGGGGKGIRIARSAGEFAAALVEARTEAARSFGDDSVIVERYVERPRHIEVQVFGDKHGNYGHLGTRECSVQRRYQKLFEEAPAPNLPEATRNGLHDAAVALAASVGYDSAGTVEFIVDDETGDFYFLEMNTRLQVEHPVTEAITGLDLVELMLDVALGRPLPDLTSVAPSGHALEARITAEDAAAGFTPAVGEIRALRIPEGVRWDGGGRTVTTDYDAMIAKLIVHGDDRGDALAKMRAALDELIIAGVTTVTGFHRWLLDEPALLEARITTRYLDEQPPPAVPELQVEVAARLFAATDRAVESASVWSEAAGFSLTPQRSADVVGLVDGTGESHTVIVAADDDLDVAQGGVDPVFDDGPPLLVAFNVDGHTQTFERMGRTELWAAGAEGRAGSGDALVAPFPAAVAEVHVTAGESVAGGQVLVVIEAMKMLHSLTADGAATIADVLVAPGDQVSSNQLLITFATDSPAEQSQA